MADKLNDKLVKSAIGAITKQRKTVKATGLSTVQKKEELKDKPTDREK